MRASEYFELAEEWRDVLKGLRAVEGDFCEVPFPEGVSGMNVPDALDEYGYWITSGEFYQLQEAITLMETLTGRAFERAGGLVR